MNYFKTLVCLVALVAFYASPAWAKLPPNLMPYAYMEPAEFEGTWYELGLVPYFFEKKCEKNPIVKYTLLPKKNDRERDTFIDYFECDRRDKKQINTGRLRVSETQSNTILSATFLNLLGWRYWFGDNYIILDINEKEQTAVIGSPKQKLAWLFRRQPKLTPKIAHDTIALLKRNGYQTPCSMVLMPHDKGELSTKMSICQFLETNNP